MKLAKALTLVAALSLATNAFAQTHNESGDAGGLPATAQDALPGGGALTNIAGSGGTTDVDMYAIQINDPQNFLATTNEPEGGTASFDTQLWLFDSGGYGILGNDDSPNGHQSFHSSILPVADDGTGQTIPGAGVYYLAVSAFNNDPFSAGGDIFFQASFSENSGPDGAGAGSPVSGWDSNTAGSSSYNIFLQGTKGVPEPATLGLLGLGALAMIRRRR